MSKAYLIDMDGVLIKGNQLIPGSVQFIGRLKSMKIPFLVLTNNSRFTSHDLQARLHVLGLEIPSDLIFTSATATARFLQGQRPGGSAYVIGETGLMSALHEVGYTLRENLPDYVVLGETISYSFDYIATAMRLVAGGARFIATNPDVIGPSEQGIKPACGAIAAMITAATGVKPYFVGKPNPVMMRWGLRYLGVHSEETVIIGDRMDTDIVAGIESGMDTILVLTGVTQREDVNRYPYLPGKILSSVADIEL
jgi:NagD protein